MHGWGISDPHHQTRMLAHFAGGKNRNLLQVIRSYSPIFIAMKICFLGGLGLSLPIILYFVGSFVVPGLTHKEKRVFFPGCVAATLLFLAGASMTYFFILPLSLAFTIEFSFNQFIAISLSFLLKSLRDKFSAFIIMLSIMLK